MSNKPILFYSPTCDHSIKLWKRLKDSNILDKLVKININKTNQIPNNINRTPTLLIKNREPLVGQAIELYLRNANFETQRDNRIPNNPNKTPNNPNNTPNNTPNTESSIQDYLPSEMGSSWSDNYSFISEDSKPKPINHSFQWLNQDSKIKCKEEHKAKGQSNIIDSRLENLKKERESVFQKRI